MKNLLFTLVIFISVLALSSCKEKVNGSYIEKVDSLELRLEVAQKLLVSLDTNVIGQHYKETNDNLKLIQELRKDRKDTLSKEIGFLLSDYSANRKSCKSFLLNYKKQAMEYEKSKKQLENLRLDFSNDLVPKEKIEEYLKVEGQAIAAFIQSADNMEVWHQTAIEQHEAKHPAVLTYIKELK
ncbi:MAG: hypothetical protein MRY83_17755 [Flavobacteriales bacterium]|nr:hypothetical protein [Flavobacteriales bacterium]